MSTKEIVWRVAAIAVLLSVGVGVFAWVLYDLNNRDDGWDVIEANTTNVHCGDDFTFYYYFGQGETTLGEEIGKVYTAAAEKAYWLFDQDAQSDEYKNLYYLNTHVNEVVTVDPALYAAFQLLESYGSRSLYLGPVYTEYNNIFRSEDDAWAMEWDPRRNADAAAYVAELVTYTNDPEMIRLELLGNDQVKLTVAQEYLAYAQANEITEFLDFHWMETAFAIDYLAESVAAAGYENFYITCGDRLVRRIDPRDSDYSLNVYDMYDGTLYPAGVLQYGGPMSIVCLRDYILLETDYEFYYEAPDRTVTTSYIDPADGLCKSATNNLILYSETASCAETLLRAADVYITDTLDTEALKAMAAEGYDSLWCEGTVINATDSDLVMYSLFKLKDIEYTVKKVLAE